MCLSHRGAVPWLSSLSHLAISLSLTDNGLHLSDAMERLPCLRTLSVVYSSEGRWEYDVDTPTPDPRKGERLSLSRMSAEEEGVGSVVWADHTVHVLSEELDIVWEKTASEHLREVARDLVKGDGFQIGEEGVEGVEGVGTVRQGEQGGRGWCLEVEVGV